MTKIAAADVVVWSDEMQFSRGGFTNRNRLPNGDWLTIPVEAGSTGLPINRVRLVNHAGRGWRAQACRQLRGAWPGELVERMSVEILRPYRLLVGMNVALLRLLCAELAPNTVQVFQSHLDGGHAVPMVSDRASDLVPASERLAMMVEEVGGDVYLSGPSGRNYLDETPFAERGIEVRYWHHDGPNPCALALTRPALQVAA